MHKELLCFLLALLLSQTTSNVIDQKEDIRMERRVFNGAASSRGEFPYQASLMILGDSRQCGGSLIDPSWVLTAAHCIKSNDIIVTLGIVDLWDWRYAVRRFAAEIHVHEQYNASFMLNDIALIKLDAPVIINEYVNVISLPTHNEDPASLNSNLVCVSGWGKTTTYQWWTTRILQHSLIRLMDHAQCQKTLKQDVPPSQVCTDKSFKYSGPCQSDSGGPIADCAASCRCKTGARQVGIVSYATTDKCESREPVVYTNVAFYREWILSKTGI